MSDSFEEKDLLRGKKKEGQRGARILGPSKNLETHDERTTSQARLAKEDLNPRDH